MRWSHLALEFTDSISLLIFSLLHSKCTWKFAIDNLLRKGSVSEGNGKI